MHLLMAGVLGKAIRDIRPIQANTKKNIGSGLPLWRSTPMIF
jgi:hypothetical protein